MRAYEGARQELNEHLSTTTVWYKLEPNVLVPPQPLQILCRGFIEGSAQMYDVDWDQYLPGAGRVGSSSHDDLLNTLTRVDFVSVVALVLSFLAIVLGFDAICGEREQGTLRLVLSHSVSRAQIVAAKLLGGFLSVWIPMALAFVSCLLVIQANPDVDLSADDWLRLVCLFALTCLFLAQVYAVAVLVSAYTRRASTSLIICLFGWLVLGSGYSSALPSIARYTIDWPPWEEFVEQENGAWSRYSERKSEWEKQHPAPSEAHMQGLWKDNIIHYLPPAGQAWFELRVAWEFDAVMDRADEIRRFRMANQMPLAHQQFFVDRWAILSPFASYRALSKWLVRSTLEDNFVVSEYGVQYRQTYLDFVRGRAATVGWRRWITDDPPATPPMIADPDAATADDLQEGSLFLQQANAAAEARWERDKDHRSSLDLTGLPQVGDGWRRSFSESLARMLPGILVLVLTLGAAVMLTLRRFSRYQLS